MAVISDLGGTSQNSFSINGKITLFQGEGIPSDLMGNNGDVYFKHEGLIYVKRNGTWLTNDPEDIKWIPDPRNHQNRLLYSSGENYEMTEITYNNNSEEPHQLELFTTPSANTETSSMIVPNIGWINDPEKNNVLHKSGNESKTDTLSLKNKFGTLGDNNISSNELKYIDNNNTLTAYIKNILNTLDGSSVNNNSSILELGSISGSTNSKIQIISNYDGTSYITIPTPSINANNNEAINAEWANNIINGLKNQINDLTSEINNLRTTINHVEENAVGQPNYINQQQISSGFVTPQAGWIKIKWNEGHNAVVYYNGSEIGGGYGGSSKDNSNIIMLLPVSKNITVTWSQAIGCWFIPNL